MCFFIMRSLSTSHVRLILVQFSYCILWVQKKISTPEHSILYCLMMFVASHDFFYESNVRVLRVLVCLPLCFK